MFNFRKFSSQGFDWTLLVTALLLAFIGLAAIYSVDLSRGTDLIFFKKQLLALFFGLGVLSAASFTRYTFFRSYAKWLYWLAIFSLVLVLFFGRNIRGTTGWFIIGNFSFQPVEFAKVGIILMLGYFIAHSARRFDKPLFFFGSGFLSLLIIILVMLQPDFGSAVIIGLIWFGLVILMGTRRLFVISLVSGALLLLVFGWFFLFQDYQKERVLNFINPERDPLKSGYNVNQSLIAVGAGQILGRGLGFGSQSQLRFLPEAQTDFIFSVIGEELGLAGALIVIVLFGIIFWRLLLISSNTGDDFVATVTAGIAILFFAQFFINVGASIGIMPVTGVTLPFVSYGGSSLMMNMFLIGIAESMAKKRT